MAIVDLTFINDKCDKDSAIVLVNSGDRDIFQYPSPTRYVLNFDEPLKLVYGISILDGMIPNTLYNNDHHNNMFSIMKVTGTRLSMEDPTFIPSSNPFEDIRVTGDPYQTLANSFQYHLYQLKNNRLFREVLYHSNGKNMTYHVVIVSQFVYDTYLKEQCEYDWQIDENVKQGSLTIFIQNQRQVTILSNFDGRWTSNIDYVCFDDNKQLYAIPLTEIEDIRNFVENNQVVVNGTNQITWYDTKWTKHTSAMDNAISNATNSLHPLVQENIVWLQMINIYIPLGNYETNLNRPDLDYASTIQANINTYGKKLYRDEYVNIFDNIAFTMDLLTRKLVISSTEPFVLLMGKSTCSTNMGLATKPHITSTVYNGVTYGNDALFYMSKLQVMKTSSGSETRYGVLPDGIINLTSLPFIVLRFREIDEHVQRNIPFGKHGFGVFKLAGGLNEIAHLRFDFQTFVKRPFHPISKLSKLTIEFEMPDGKPYDFKGIDHMFVMSVNYYVPRPEYQFDTYKLNPSYNPDYLKYVTDAMTENIDRMDPECKEVDVRRIEQEFYSSEEYSDTDSE